MKKILKKITTIFLLCTIIVGGLLVAYHFNEKSKVADVVALTNYSIDEYWGDDIQSYGTVSSEQAQIVYVANGEKVSSLNVKVGDHVSAGDVLFSVDKQSVDIKGKALEIQQAKQSFNVEMLKLERLQKQKPVPDASRVYTNEVESTKKYVSEITYYATAGFEGEFTDEDGTKNTIYYSTGDKVAEVFLDTKGKILSTVYFDEHGNTIANYTGTEVSPDDDINFTKEEHSDTFSWIRKLEYFDGETGQFIGADTFDADGEKNNDFVMPKGYTAQQLEEEIKSSSHKIKEDDLRIRILQNELEYMIKNANTGDVIANVSGTVVKLQDVNNINHNKPFITVTATDEYYISGTIGEFNLDKVKPGDTVSVTSWDTGVSIDAKVTTISDSPSKDLQSYGGNGNVSNYEFRAAFANDSRMDIGTAVDIKIPSKEQDKGLFIYTALIRKDSKGKYVMKMGDDKTLEKQYVEVGRDLWGMYTEIKNGVSKDDYLAFPYANGAKDGIACNIVESLENY